MRSTRRALAIAPLLALALMTAGCATPGEPEPDEGTTPPEEDDVTDEPAPGGTGPTSLTITVDATGDGDTTTWELTCDPAGGTHPDPEGACAALAAAGTGVFDPVPADQMCTQQYGGPQTATVVGTVDGHEVDATFEYTNGCEITRWDTLDPLLPSGDMA